MPTPTADRVQIFRPVGSRAFLPFRTVRPSVLDLRFTGDSWVGAGRGGSAALFLDGYQLARISASPLDLPSLNRTLDRLRRPTRCRRCV
jgi:hypothetical protein